ncbi:MAG: ACT domain-containing protein [Nanoarchaeota archaeon]|nr:ACT domain-containing protein [Nanoarchaeota archaeon]
MPQNLSQISREFVDARPMVGACLTRGWINCTSLARDIAHAHRVEKKHLPAIGAALRRMRPLHTESKELGAIKVKTGITEGQAKLAEISVATSDTAGGLAQLSTLLSSRNISVVRASASQGECVVLVKESDVSKAMAALGK